LKGLGVPMNVAQTLVQADFKCVTDFDLVSNAIILTWWIENKVLFARTLADEPPEIVDARWVAMSTAEKDKYEFITPHKMYTEIVLSDSILENNEKQSLGRAMIKWTQCADYRERFINGRWTEHWLKLGVSLDGVQALLQYLKTYRNDFAVPVPNTMTMSEIAKWNKLRRMKSKKCYDSLHQKTSMMSMIDGKPCHKLSKTSTFPKPHS
jgi:hypothetical protein